MNILLTGGAGYIGSHLTVFLQQSGYKVILFDNFKNSSEDIFSKIAKTSGSSVELVHGDLKDTQLLINTFKKFHIDKVIHLAALKSIPDSLQHPLEYYENNLGGSLSLLSAMQRCGVCTLIFSSSCAVYGHIDSLPLKESDIKNPENPYGKSKLMMENILKDMSGANNKWRIACLRYANVVGTFSPSMLSLHTLYQSDSIFSIIAKTISGKITEFPIYGHDYPTRDGTTIRDYIHVIDLARAHLAILNWMKKSPTHFEVFNLGTGKGYSVLEVLNTFEKCLGKKIPYKFFPRRPGDVVESYCSIKKAKEILNWIPEKTLEDMCKSLV